MQGMHFKGDTMTPHSKIKVCISLIAILLLGQGCQFTKKEVVYPYPDSKTVIVTSKQFNVIQIGMTEMEVFQLTDGSCTLISESGYPNTKNYGCNGKGKVGANVVLIFSEGRLNVKTQFGLE